MAVSREVEFVLNYFEKLYGFGRLGVVICRGSVKIKHLTIQYFLGRTYVADSIKQFPPVGASRIPLQTFIVKGKSFNHVFFDPSCCPLAEVSGN